MNFKPRPYQEKAIQIGIEVLKGKRKEVLVEPTGAGKSWIIGGICKELSNDKILVIQPTFELLEQNVSKINALGVEVSVFSASAGKKETEKNLIYATLQSLTYESFKDLNVKYVIVDEVDFATQPKTEFVKLLTQLKIKSCLGLTASPFYTIQTNNGAVTEIMTQVKGSYFKNIANIHQIQDMVDNKYWSNFQYFNVFYHSKQGLLKLNDSGSEFTELSQKEFYDKCDLKTKISDFLSRLPENENALVFVPDIEKAEELKELIPNSAVVHSKVNKKLRKENVDNFKSNECRIAITPLALAVGFDKEDLLNIVDATPTNSVRVNMQKIGRICRLHKDKELGRVIDFAGNFNRFGDIRDYTFENIKGYGWVLLDGENVLTGIPMDKVGTITREYIVKNGKPNFEYIFGEDNDGSAKMSAGKYKGKTLKWLYYQKRFYLKWLIQVDYNFKEEDKEFERQLKQIFNA